MDHFHLIKGIKIAEFSKLPAIKFSRPDIFPVTEISERSKRKIAALGETVVGARAYNITVDIFNWDENGNKIMKKQKQKSDKNISINLATRSSPWINGEEAIAIRKLENETKLRESEEKEAKRRLILQKSLEKRANYEYFQYIKGAIMIKYVNSNEIKNNFANLHENLKKLKLFKSKVGKKNCVENIKNSLIFIYTFLWIRRNKYNENISFFTLQLYLDKSFFKGFITQYLIPTKKNMVV